MNPETTTLQKDHYFVNEKFLGLAKKDLQPYQNEIIEMVFKYDRVSVKSCHNTGKTFLAADTILCYLYSRYPCTVVTTAPTTNLLQNQLWAEIRRLYNEAPVSLGGKLLDVKCSLTLDDKWFAIGFVPRKDLSQSQSDFQGFHNDHLLVVFDEATGIDPKVWDMTESMMTAENTKWLTIANPTDGTAEFAKCFKSPLWKNKTITCFDSPNLIINNLKTINDLRREAMLIETCSTEDEKDAILTNYKVDVPYLLTAKAVVSALIKWGESSPWFQGRMLATFPEISDDVLISFAAIETAAMKEWNGDAREVLGVDVARFGKDKTVIKHMKGNEVIYQKLFTKKDTSVVAGWIKAYCIDNPMIHKIGVDDTGVGGGVTDQLNQSNKLKTQAEIIPINFGCKSTEPEKYANLKAEIFWLLKRDIEDNIKTLNCDVTNSQLSSLKYRHTGKGQIQIESKDEMKKRGLPSPDNADALGIANYIRNDVSLSGSFRDIKKPEKSKWNSGGSW